MIVQFPPFLPDELVYSLLARFYMQSGYLRYTFAAEDLFRVKTVRPDIEYINQFTPAVLQMIIKDAPIEQVIEKHTMFPYYGRFLPYDRRHKSFQAMATMQGNYNNLLPMPKRKTNEMRYLRYCPICAENDRKEHGETYWHRIHQLQGVDVCPFHGCYLRNSNTVISGKASPMLVTAEESIANNNEAEMCDNEIELQLAKYVCSVFQAAVDIQSDVLVGDFLHGRMSGTKYRSVRGEQRNIALFHAEFSDYYKSLSDNWFTELWQIQKVLANNRINMVEICMIAMFLDVPTADLCHMKLPEKKQEQLFDEQIFMLHEQGLKYPEIAKRLNAPYDTVKAVGEKKYKAYRKEPKKPLKCGAKSYNWQQIDRDTLPLVKEAIRQLQGDGVSRPKKVTVFAVEKLLELPSKRISSYLPMCKAEIKKYEESQEQYWAREVAWAVNKIIREGDVLNWKHIRNLTNMRKCDFVVSVPYLHMFVDDKLVNQINGLL